MPLYPGTGKATLLNANTQGTLFSNDRTGSGSPGKASVAFQLERQKSAFYPFGFAIELVFSAAPGSFEVEVQGAETDTDANYCKMGTSITAVNGSNVARFEGVNLYPKFVRLNMKTLGNDVLTSAILTR